MNAAEARFSELLTVADWTARHVASRFRGYVEFEDLRQEALVWLLDPAHASRITVDDEGKIYGARVHAELMRYLVPKARAERTAKCGGDPDDNKRYNMRTVRAVLPAVWTGEGVVRTESEIRAAGDPAEGGTWLVSVMDVARALRHTVGLADQAILFARHVLGESWEVVAAGADTEDATADSVRMRATRAERAIVDFLNGIEPIPGWGGPGSRHAHSNNYMQHKTDAAYSGDGS